MTTVEAWAVKAPDGNIIAVMFHTVPHLDPANEKKGYRCVRVRIEEVRQG